MIQNVLVTVIFLSALAFLASLLIRNLRAKDGCVTGCGKCSADFSKLDVELKNSPVKPRP